MTSTQHAEGRQFDPGQVYVAVQACELPPACGCLELASRPVSPLLRPNKHTATHTPALMLVDIHSPCGTGTTHIACALLFVHTASSNTRPPHEGNGVAQSPTTRTHCALQSCASLHVAKIKLAGARLLNWLLKYTTAGFESNL